MGHGLQRAQDVLIGEAAIADRVLRAGHGVGEAAELGFDLDRLAETGVPAHHVDAVHGLESAAQLVHVKVVVARVVFHGVAGPPAPAVVPQEERVVARWVVGSRPVDEVDERLRRAHVGGPPVGRGVVGGGRHALRDVEDARPGPRTVGRAGEPPAVGQGDHLHVGVGTDRRHLLVDVVSEPRPEVQVAGDLVAVHVDHDRPRGRRRGARRGRRVGGGDARHGGGDQQQRRARHDRHAGASQKHDSPPALPLAGPPLRSRLRAPASIAPPRVAPRARLTTPGGAVTMVTIVQSPRL